MGGPPPTWGAGLLYRMLRSRQPHLMPPKMLTISFPRISHPGVLYQECLGYQQERRQALSAEPLADEVRAAHTLAAVDRGEAAAFAVERIGAPRVNLVVALAFPNLVVEDLDELQVTVDGGMAPGTGMVDDVQIRADGHPGLARVGWLAVPRSVGLDGERGPAAQPAQVPERVVSAPVPGEGLLEPDGGVGRNALIQRIGSA